MEIPSMDATTLMSDRTTIGVPRETAPGERRVALVPDVVRRLAATGSRSSSSPGPAPGR